MGNFTHSFNNIVDKKEKIFQSEFANSTAFLLVAIHHSSYVSLMLNNNKKYSLFHKNKYTLYFTNKKVSVFMKHTAL